MLVYYIEQHHFVPPYWLHCPIRLLTHVDLTEQANYKVEKASFSSLGDVNLVIQETISTS